MTDYTKLIEDSSMPLIESQSMKRNLVKIFENTEKALMTEATETGDVAQYTPVLMSLIRRVMPTLCGTQMYGVQSLNLPTGRIFAQHVYYGKNKQGGTETWANGTVGTADAVGAAPDATYGGPYTTKDGEKLGWREAASDGANVTESKLYKEMSFAIDYIDVSVQTRALKGKLTTELLNDLKAVHNLDGQQEMANILQSEIAAEIDRELVDRMNKEAKTGAQNCTEKGVFDFAVDADGRWSMEKVQGLLIQIEREATQIAQETRRGRGNFILTSPEVAAYLSMANLITTNYKNTGFTNVINPVGISYYGMLCGRYKVFVDPYATSNSGKHQITIGYKGANEYDAGIFYCPYIPLQFFSVTDPESFGSILGVKSRYGIVSNPYYCASSSTAATDKTNSFYRKFEIKF